MMKNIFLAALLLLSTAAYAEDKPTFDTTDQAPDRETGLVKPVLTLQQFQADKEYKVRSRTEGWTFQWDASQLGKHPLNGLQKIEREGEPLMFAHRGEKLTPFDVRSFGKKLTPILDQGQCGSCVVFAVLRAWMDTMLIRDLTFPLLSAQELMNCGGQAGQCSGDYGERVAARLKKIIDSKGGLVPWDDYKYTARNASCTDKTQSKRYGKLDSAPFLEPTHENILAALHNGQVVATAINAGGSWGAYKSGIYNACGSTAQNHYVAIRGMTCGTSVDASGNCVFDDNGMLPKGVGTFIIDNSWSVAYGDDGSVEMLITSRNGTACNGVGQEALVFDVGIPIPPAGPQEFKVTGRDVACDAVLQPGAKYTAAEAKAAVALALKSQEK